MGKSILKCAEIAGLIRFIILMTVGICFLEFLPILGYSFNDVIGNYCEIHTYEDYIECSKSNQHFVKVYSDYALEAGYEYHDANTDMVLSKFVDFEIPLAGTESYMSLLGIVSASDFEKMQEEINQGKMVSYVGHLAELDSTYTEGLSSVVDGFVDYYTGTDFYNENGFVFTEDEVYDFILPLQINGYDDSTTSMYVYVGIFGAFSLFCFVIAIFGLLEFLNPKRNSSFKNLSDEDLLQADREYQQNEFSLNEKKFKISEHFFYILNWPNIAIGKIADVTDLSLQEVRSRGIVTNRYLKACLQNGKILSIAVKKKNISKYINELLKKNPNIEVDSSCGFNRESNSSPKKEGKN